MTSIKEYTRKGINKLNKEGNGVKYDCRFYSPAECRITHRRYLTTFEESLEWIQEQEFNFYYDRKNRQYLPKGISLDINAKLYKLQVINTSVSRAKYLASSKDLEEIKEYRVKVINSLLDI